MAVSAAAPGTTPEDIRAYNLWVGGIENQDDTYRRYHWVMEMAWHAALAWERSRPEQTEALPVLRVGTLEVCPDDIAAWIGGVPLHLTPSEYRVVRALAERSPQVVHRAALTTAQQGLGFAYTGQKDGRYGVDVHIARLRRKLAAFPGAPVIEAVRSSFRAGEGGYRLVEVTG